MKDLKIWKVWSDPFRVGMAIREIETANFYPADLSSIINISKLTKQQASKALDELSDIGMVQGRWESFGEKWRWVYDVVPEAKNVFRDAYEITRLAEA